VPEPVPAQRTLQFGAFQLNVATGELRKSGVKLRLRPQPAKALAFLASRPGETIKREQLREEIWGRDVFVDFEHGLNLCIREVRAALDDDADKPRYIETVPRIGYRFIGHVEAAVPRAEPAVPAAPKSADPGRNPDASRAAHSPNGKHRRRLAAAVASAFAILALIVLLVLGGLREGRSYESRPPLIKSLAVFPLENLSGDPAQQYFADGMTDELTTELAKIHSLRVISRNSIVQYRGRTKPLPQIARELNVDAVVEGTVMRSGDRVRITAQLIEASSDRHLWAESYERDMHDVLKLQDDFARDIARQVRAALTPTEQGRLARTSSVNPQAYESLLRGRYEWAKRGQNGLTNALASFRKSTQLDPNYAPAYAGIAESYEMLGNNGIVPTQTVRTQAKEAALRALELDPDLSEAHVALAEWLNDYDWNWAEAEKEYRHAIELDSNNANAHHWYAMSLAWVGRFNEAIREIEYARQLDPVAVRINANVGLILLYARQYDRAIAESQKTLELEPNDFTSHFVIGMANLEKGDILAAINELQAARGSSPPPAGLYPLAYAYGTAGQKSKALSVFEEWRQACRERYCSPTGWAYAYAALGQRDEAFAWLDKAIAVHDQGLHAIDMSPMADPLRSDRRFADVLRRRGLPE
jgi:TolB-like protein/DNA-binding winged helix-turn-helix (wHTH) protein/Tfp pilus assembly protein PilF